MRVAVTGSGSLPWYTEIYWGLHLLLHALTHLTFTSGATDLSCKIYYLQDLFLIIIHSFLCWMVYLLILRISKMIVINIVSVLSCSIKLSFTSIMVSSILSTETLITQVPSIPNVEAKCNCKFSLTWPYLDDCGEFYLGLMAAKWVLMTLTRHL